MTELSALGEYEATALLRIDKADGRVVYMRVADGVTTEISYDEYTQEGGI